MESERKLKEVRAILREFARALDSVIPPERVEWSTAELFAITLFRRMHSTFLALELLINQGHHDEAYVLLRRQLEDSHRIHYLATTDEDPDELVLGFIIGRDRTVAKRVDSTHSAVIDSGQKTQAAKIASIRWDRVREMQEYATEKGIEIRDFPAFEVMARANGRDLDRVIYASASEAAHSAVSAVTDGYILTGGADQPSRLMALTSEDASTRIGLGRQSVNQTGSAGVFCLRFLDEVAQSQVLFDSASEGLSSFDAIDPGL